MHRLVAGCSPKTSLTSQELAELLGLSDSLHKQYIRIELLVAGQQLVVLAVVNLAEQYQ